MLAFLRHIGLLDGIAFCLVAWLVIRGFKHGFSGEIGRFFGFAAGTAVGVFGYKPIARTVLATKLFIANPYAGRFIAFIVLLVVCIAVWLLVRYLFADGIKLVLPQPADAIAGGVLGGIKAAVIILALCALGLLNPQENARTRLQEMSVTVQKLAPFLEPVTHPER